MKPIKAKTASLFLLFGVMCFLLGAVALALGRLEAPLNVILPALGLIFIGVGATGKRLLAKE